MSRTENSAKNVVVNVSGQLINTVLQFFCRTFFIYYLGKQYLGISSLLANILSLLSTAELGFGVAIAYSLYKPLAEDDRETVKSLMAFFRKAYMCVGLAVGVIGLCLIPFLPNLLKNIPSDININLFYGLYLARTVLSYVFFAYKGILLQADQKKYITDSVEYAAQILMNLAQIIAILLTGSFLLYTILMVVFTLLQNAVIAWEADRRYPYLKEHAEKLDKGTRRNIFNQVYAAALYRISMAVGGATDNLVISAMVSTVMVGICDNYNVIIAIFQKIIMGVMNSFTGSLGNLVATEDSMKSEKTFRCLNLFNNYVVAFCSVGFLSCFQPLILMWIGKEYILPWAVLIVLVYNFATNYIENTVRIFNDVSGTFIRGKYRAVATAVVNLVSSIILTKYMGLPGVFLGSIVSRLTTIWWYDSLLLYKYVFKTSPKMYFVNYLVTMALIGAVGTFTVRMTINLPTRFLRLICGGVLGSVLITLCFWVIYRRTEEYAQLKLSVGKLLKKRIFKRR